MCQLREKKETKNREEDRNEIKKCMYDIVLSMHVYMMY